MNDRREKFLRMTQRREQSLYAIENQINAFGMKFQ
jgi:hypothetical protein